MERIIYSSHVVGSHTVHGNTEWFVKKSKTNSHVS